MDNQYIKNSVVVEASYFKYYDDNKFKPACKEGFSKILKIQQ